MGKDLVLVIIGYRDSEFTILDRFETLGTKKKKIVCKDGIWGQIRKGKIKFEQRDKRLYPRGRKSHRDFGNDMTKMLEFFL